MIKKYFLILITFLSCNGIGLGQATLPTSRSLWNAGVPTGWTDFGTGSYTSSFACGGDNNGGRLDGSTKFKVNKEFIINKLEILDLLGRNIYSIVGSSNEEVHFLPQLHEATYLVKAKLSNRQIIVKKIVKR